MIWLGWAVSTGLGADSVDVTLLDELEVLAFDPTNGRAALRLVAHSADIATDCGYAGMAETPTHGVQLWLWDQGSTEVFEVYAVPVEHPKSGKKCTPGADSKATLAKAKARFAQVGLDIEAGPVPWVDAGDGAWVVGGTTLTVRRDLRTQPELDDELERRDRDRDWDLLTVRMGDTTVVEHWSGTGYWGPPEGRVSWTVRGGVAAGGKALLVLQRVNTIFGPTSTLELIVVDLASPQPAVPMNPPVLRPSEAVGATLEVQDVDLDAGLVAYKITGRHPKQPKACGYAGMEDPSSGVILGLADLRFGSVIREHDVYRMASDEAREKRDCSTDADSAAALAAAKALSTSRGLDRTRKPVGLPLAPGVKLPDGRAATAEGRGLSVGRTVLFEAPERDFAGWDRVWVDGGRAFATWFIDDGGERTFGFSGVLEL